MRCATQIAEEELKREAPDQRVCLLLPKKLSKKRLTMKTRVGEHETYRQTGKDSVCSDWSLMVT